MKTSSSFTKPTSLLFGAMAVVATAVMTPHPVSASPRDLDGDGIPNRIDPDVDNDGKLNRVDANIDGGVSKRGPKAGEFVGDRRDNRRDADMDGDLVANSRDADMDGDGVVNAKDADANADGRVDAVSFGVGALVDFTDDNGNGFFLQEGAGVEELRAGVLAALSTALGVSESKELRVAVASVEKPSGTWSYLTGDGIIVNGVWKVTEDEAASLRLFLSNAEGENRFYAQYPNGPVTFYSWQPGEPVGFSYASLSAEATGRPTPLAALDRYFGGFADLQRDDFGSTVIYSGTVGAFAGIAPVIAQQRAIQEAAR